MKLYSNAVRIRSWGNYFVFDYFSFILRGSPRQNSDGFFTILTDQIAYYKIIDTSNNRSKTTFSSLKTTFRIFSSYTTIYS